MTNKFISFVNRANTPPVGFKHASRILTILLVLLTFGVGNVWGATTYTLIKSNSSLSTGDKVVIVMSNTTPTNGTSTGVTGWNNDKDATVSTTEANWVQYTVGSASASGWTLYDETAKKYIASPTGNHFKYADSGGTCSVNSDGVLTCSSRYLVKNSSYYRMYTSIGSYTPFYVWKVSAGTTPTITKNSSMTTFGCNMTTGVPTKQSFTVSGTNLKEAISVTPPSGYEISTAENGTYQSTAISLSKNGSNAVATTTIWVRLKEDNAAGSYSGNIACESTDATTQNVAVSGSTPFKVTWVANNNTESPYATTYVTYASGEGTALGSLPTDPDPDDYCGDVFYGWYEGSYKNASVAPSVISTSTKITEDKTYNAVFADEEDGGSTIKYKLVSSLTNGKDYIFVSRNTTGSGYALSSTFSDNENTGTAVSIEASGDDYFVSGTPANSIIWTAATGWSLTTKDNTKTGTKLKINGNTFALDATGSTNLTWSDKGLNGQSGNGNTKYYVQCSNGKFTKSNTTGSTSSRVWAYEKTTVSVKTQSNFTTTCCTSLGSINGSFTVDQNVVVNETDVTVSLVAGNIVEGATGYRFVLYDNTATPTEITHKDVNQTSNVSCTFGSSDGIKVGTTYKVSVITLGDGSTNCEVGGESSKIAVEVPDQSVWTVSYDANTTDDVTGMPAAGTQILQTAGTGNLSDATPARTGYTFVGWSDASGANNTKNYNAGGEITITGDKTVYAVWSATNYSVTMAKSPAAAASDEAVVISENQSNKHYGETIPVSVTAHPGYVFTGWSADPSVTFANASAESTTFTMPASDVTVTASFAPVLSTMAEIQGAAASEKKNVNISITNWIVTARSSNGNQVWMTAENNTKGILLYKSGNKFAVGNKLNGVVQNTELQQYNGYAELLSLVSTEVTIAEGTFDVTPRTTTIADLYTNFPAENGTVIKLSGLTYSSSNSNFSDGTRTIVIDNKMSISLITPSNGEKYDLSGAVEYTQSSNQLVIKIIPRATGDLVHLTCDVNPTLGATSVDEIGEEGVTLKSAGISAIGDYCEISSYGFEYSTSSNFANATHVEVGTTYTTANTAFQKVIASGLTPLTKYYVRAYATNGHGTTYAELEDGFTTLASTAKVISITPATSHDFEQVLTTANAQTWTFNVKGANLDENVVITGASAPITLSSSSLAYASVNGENGVDVTVTLTPNGAANVNQTLTLTSGTASATVTIQASVVAPYEVTFSVPTGLTAPQVQSVTPGQAADLTVTPTGSLAECMFLGWVSAQHAEQVAAIDPLESYTPTGNATLYALFRRADMEDKEGYALSVVYSDATKYVGPYSSSNYNFSVVTSLEDAELFGLDEEGYIYAYINGTKSYLKCSGWNDNKAAVSFADKEANASWTISDLEASTFTITTTVTTGVSANRLLGYNHNNDTGNNSKNRFAAYASTLNGAVFDFAKTATTKEVGTNYYSTAPVVATLTSIEVTTEPTKKNYYAGDDFDPTGMVVKAHFSGGKADKIIKHSDLTISPSTSLTAGTTSVTISYGGQSTSQAITVTAIALSSINLEGPTQTTYTQGDAFSTAGLVVNAVFNDETKNRVLASNEYEVSTPNMSTLGQQTITVSFTYAGTTKTADFSIQVNSALESISANTENVKMTYIEGEAFDPKGLVVTASYSVGDPHAVTGYTCTPTGALKTIGELSDPTAVQITVTYLENTTEVSTTFNVTVNPYPKRTVTFSINGNTETSATETTAQGGINKPSDPAGVGDYTFAGWSQTARAVESIADPELVEWPYYPESDEILYAVYTINAEAEIHGMYLTAEVDDNHTEKTIGYFDNKELKPTDNGDHQSPLAMWFMDGYLFYMDGTDKKYVYNEGSAADLKVTTTAPSSHLWEKISNDNGTVTFKRSENRILAWNTSYFRAYASSGFPRNEFTVAQATETIVETVPYYTTSPSTDVTPVLSFDEATPSINVLDGDGNLNTYLNTLNNGGSTGSVTYVSSDEAIATVANDGTVTAVKGGTVTITANVAAVPGSYKAASKSYTLTINKMTASASFGEPATTNVYVANTIALPATSEDAITITYRSSNKEYATVDGSGNVTGVSTGGSATRSITIYAEWEATDIYEASTNSTCGKVNVTVKNNAKTQTLSFDETEKLFTPQSGDQTYANVLSGAVTAVTYASNNTTFAEVDANTGEVTIHTNVDGSATITATAAEANVTEGGIIYHYAQAQASYVISLDYPRPTFSIESCDIKAPISVTISSDEPTILYTLDETTPSYANSNGQTYSGPIAIDETTTLKAIAVSGTGAESPVTTATYTKILPTVTCNVTDGGSVPAGTGAVVLTAAEDALITYELVNSVNTVLASGTDVHAPINLDVTMGSGYTLTIQSQWDCENAYYTEDEITFNATGAGYLPIYYNDNKTNLPVYFTPSSGMGNYDSAENTKIKFSNPGQNLVVQFANEPAKLSYTLKLNGSGTDYEFKVEESEDGTNYSTLREHTSSTYALTSNEEATFSNIDLASTTRYIRWTYTTKPTGSNIGLGNITITASNTGSITIDGVNVTELPDGFQGNVTVVNGGTLNVSEAKTLTNLTVEAGGKVTGSATLNVQDLTINTSLGTISGNNNTGGKSGEILNPDNITANGDVWIEIELTQDAAASYGWYAFSVPFPVDALNGVYYGSTKLQNEVGYAIMSHNGELRAKNEYAWKKFRDIMQPGVFYVITVGNTDYKTLRFKKVAGKAIFNEGNVVSGSNQMATKEYASEIGDNHAGWNGLGNPYLETTKVGCTYLQFYDHGDNVFRQRTGSAVQLMVGSAFFYQSDGSAITFTKDKNGSIALAPARAPKAIENTIFEVRLNDENGREADNLFLTAREEAKNEYEIGRDVAKMSMGTAKCAQMWVPAYGTQLCAADFPLVNDKATYPLTINAPSAGTYTISTTANENATLYLTKNGRIYWNLTMGACELDLAQGQNNEYGLVLRAEVPAVTTGIENGELLNGENGVQKVIIDEHVYILRGGEMYDMTGKAVK